MNVDRLRAVQSEEREADSLRPLPDAFYREVADYIDGLREERARAAEAADDPFGDEEVRRLTDEVETAEEVAEAIYERRVGKLVKRASLAAAGMPVEEEGLTTEEAELFADLVAEIEAHREEVFASFGSSGDRRSGGPTSGTAGGEPGGGPAGEGGPAGDGPEPPPAEAAPDSPDAESEARSLDETSAGTEGTTSSADAVDAPSESDEASDDLPESGEAGSGDDPPESTDGGAPDRVTLRITQDVGEVFGVDERVYDLAAEDVVTLPAPNARPLLERDAAEQVD